MNTSGPAKSSPLKGGHPQYIPSLFASNPQAASHNGGSNGADVGGTAAMDRYAHVPATYQPSGGRGAGANAVGGGRPLSESPVHSQPRSAPADAGVPAAATNPASPSPASTIDYDDIQQKQLELRSAVEYRIQSLESTLSMRDEELVRLRAQLRKLEEDYQFNYNLIGERDAALEEAAQQLQRLYREMKRVTNEGGILEKKLQAAEAELVESKRRVRDVEAASEAAIQRVRREYAIKEQHLAETVKAREAALEEQQQKAHEDYMRQVRLLEETKSEVEGRTATVSSQLEDRHRQVVQRLEDEVLRLQRRLQTVEAEKATTEGLVGQLREQNSGTQQQLDLAVQRHRVAMEETTEANQRLESQVAQTTALLNKSLATAEDAIREEVQKCSRLELENVSLQSRLAEAKAQLQEARTKQLDDTTAFAEERRALSANYEAALASMAEAERRWRDGERALQGTLAERADEMARLTRQLQDAQRGQQAAEAALGVSKGEAHRLQQEVERLTGEVRQWKEEEAKVSAAARRDQSAAEEKVLGLERAAQESRDEAERQRRKVFDQQERSQSEIARLTRELHASEAARRALEDQFHLTQDRDTQGALIGSLRYEKEVLEKRVMELERTNGEIREQVANFTLELQNDPAVKAARETQRRVQELQQELLTSRDDAQRLRDALAEKNEELARYQVDILSAQMLLGGGAGDAGVFGGPAPVAAGSAPSPPTLSASAAAALRQQHERMREEWANMRERLLREVRGKKRGAAARRRRHRTSSSSSSSTAASTASTSMSSRSGSSTGSQSRHGRRTRTPRRRHHSRRRERRASPATPPTTAAPSTLLERRPPALADEGAEVRNRHLLQESEVWRQKSLQLEQHLHAVVRERDRLRRELATAKQDITALSSEKQSLLDLNSLLKAQLREAYRTSFESFSQATSSHGVRAPAVSQAAAPAATALGALPPPEWVAAAAAALAEQQQRQRELSDVPPHPKPPRYPTASRDSAGVQDGGHPGRASTEGSYVARTSVRTPSVQRHGNAGLNTSTLSNSNSTADGSPSVTRLQQQQRLAELEEEIRSVRGQIASTMRRQQVSTSTSPASLRKEQTGPAGVHRKGSSAVRHYGYQS